MAVKFSYANRLVSFQYDAKFRDTLPVWDTHPLVYIIQIKGRYMTGINLHHLPMKTRVAFVEVMSKLNKAVGNPNRFARLTYNLIKKDRRFKGVERGFRMYIARRAINAIFIKKEDLPKFVKIQPKYIARKFKNKEALKAIKKKKAQDNRKKKASENREKRIKKRDDKKKSKKR